MHQRTTIALCLTAALAACSGAHDAGKASHAASPLKAPSVTSLRPISDTDIRAGREAQEITRRLRGDTAPGYGLRPARTDAVRRLGAAPGALVGGSDLAIQERAR